MDIYLTNKVSGIRLRIPLLPDRINIKTAATMKSISIINLGEVRIPRGTSPTGYSWNGVFPSVGMSQMNFVFDWQEPSRITKILCEWEEKGDLIELMITELSITEEVHIETFTYDYFGVGDCSYTINLTKDRKLTVSTVDAPPVTTTTGTSSSITGQSGKVTTNGSPLNVRREPTTTSTIIGTIANGSQVRILGKTGNWYIVPHEAGVNGRGYVYASYITLNTGSTSSGSSSGSGGSSSGGSSSGSGSSSYRVKAGDSLYSIAKAMLGDGNRWMEIYNLNKAAIDAANAGTTNPKYTIPAGLALKLPAKSKTATTSNAVTNAVAAASYAIANSASSAVKILGTVASIGKITAAKPTGKVIDTFKKATTTTTTTAKTTASKAATTVKKTSTSFFNLKK